MYFMWGASKIFCSLIGEQTFSKNGIVSKILVFAFTILSCFNATANNTTVKVAVKCMSVSIHYKANSAVVYNYLSFSSGLNKYFKNQNSRIKTENQVLDSLLNNYKLN